jgi:hypothetical protein
MDADSRRAAGVGFEAPDSLGVERRDGATILGGGLGCEREGEKRRGERETRSESNHVLLLP